MLKTKLEELKQYFLEDLDMFDPITQSKYIDPATGFLDRDKICRELGKNISIANFRKEVKEVFGITKFQQCTIENTITAEQFYAKYVFGKHLNVLDWINEFGDEILLRDTLFKYILEYKPEPNGIVFNAGGIYDDGEPTKLW